MSEENFQTILVVDDETASQGAIRRTLEDEFHVLTASTVDQARDLLERHEIAIILCDQRMPGMTGVMFLKEVRERWPDVVRIIISGYTDSEDIIAGINDAGIYQYILKPWFPDYLIETVKRAAEARKLQKDMLRLDLELRTSTPVLRQRKAEKLQSVKAIYDFDRIIRSPASAMNNVCELAARVARYDLSVLILGESGTGKELLARAIHYASPRAARAFVMENCAAMSDTLLESELFGHKRGSFTGAYEDHVGIFQRADGGTVFLDEIGDTSPAFQVKLLRVLQEGEVRPVGSTRAVPVNVRVIAATHRELEGDMRSGRFRQDLYYRLAGMNLTVPPLRERQGDIVPIAESILNQALKELNMPARQLAASAKTSLLTYYWPGNIRELRNEIFRALALSVDEHLPIEAHAFSSKIYQGNIPSNSAALVGVNADNAIAQSGSLQERLDAIESLILKETLLRHRWNKTHASKELGMSRVGLRAKLLRFGLEK